MEVFVGTSGWFYDWNKKRSLDWYVNNSGLNAVELNASFYRFPFPNVVKSWAEKGKGLRWSIKVNRRVTHIFRLNEKAFEVWKRFERLFEPMDHLVDFYLFQLPPYLKADSASEIISFIEKTELGRRFALETRNITWFKTEWIEWAASLGITLVSVDCPDLPLDIFNTSGIIYERMHGRREWYRHWYSDMELGEVVRKIVEANPEKAYVFFNNDHAMLENSRRMLTKMREATQSLKEED